MRGFWQLVVSQVKMLVRDRTYLVASFGIAFISMVIFGLLFGSESTSPFALGLVDEDGTVASQGVVRALGSSEALQVTEGNREEEMASLRRGDRRAVLVIGQGFQDALGADRAVLQVYYDQGNVVASSVAKATVQAIVAGLNKSITQVEEPIKLQEEGIATKRLHNIDFLTPGLLGMMLMWTNLFVGVLLIAWREQGILKRLSATPLLPAQLVGSQILAYLTISFAQAALLLVIAILWFHVSVEGSLLLLAGVVLLGALTMLALGYVVGSFIKRSESAQSAAMLISFPMMFLSGSFFPTDGAPDFVQPLIKAMPLTYLNHALREVVNNAASVGVIQTDLLVLAAWMIGSLLLSLRLFRWQ
ncbi:MAG: ABC transporter permease [Chloroflexi bacterium]|nr:ABC transporter permease [Chloroflexota bacterium]